MGLLLGFPTSEIRNNANRNKILRCIVAAPNPFKNIVWHWKSSLIASLHWLRCFGIRMMLSTWMMMATSCILERMINSDLLWNAMRRSVIGLHSRLDVQS